MALREYKCSRCGDTQYVFEGEESSRLLQGNCGRVARWCHNYEKMPPLASVVHMTEIFMLSQLDSIDTIHELCTSITREAAEDREAKAHQEARREI